MSSMKTKTVKGCRSVCPIANALDIVGDRWTLLVIRDMMFFDRHEFHEFMEAGEGISTNILADRLKRLMAEDMIRMLPHPTNKTRKLYYPTSKGKEFLPIMVEMSVWGGKHLEGSAPARRKVNQVRKNPQQFMQLILDKLDAWEREHVK